MVGNTTVADLKWKYPRIFCQKLSFHLEKPKMMLNGCLDASLIYFDIMKQQSRLRTVRFIVLEYFYKSDFIQTTALICVLMFLNSLTVNSLLFFLFLRSQAFLRVPPVCPTIFVMMVIFVILTYFRFHCIHPLIFLVTIVRVDLWIRLHLTMMRLTFGTV